MRFKQDDDFFNLNIRSASEINPPADSEMTRKKGIFNYKCEDLSNGSLVIESKKTLNIETVNHLEE
jgi:hypothetical protein